MKDISQLRSGKSDIVSTHSSMKSQRCSNCDSENRTEARFCKRCGFWLLSKCPFCNSTLPQATLFCDQCGRQLNFQVGNAPHALDSRLPGPPGISHSYQEMSPQSSFAQTQSNDLVPPPALAKSELHQYI